MMNVIFISKLTAHTACFQAIFPGTPGSAFFSPYRGR